MKKAIMFFGGGLGVMGGAIFYIIYQHRLIWESYGFLAAMVFGICAGWLCIKKDYLTAIEMIILATLILGAVGISIALHYYWSVAAILVGVGMKFFLLGEWFFYRHLSS